jgi:hypothetical protein
MLPASDNHICGAVYQPHAPAGCPTELDGDRQLDEPLS